jgi:5-deoxy-glucuronate isomerase
MQSVHPWHHPARAESTDAACAPDSSSLKWCGVDVVSLAAGEERRITTGQLERAIIPLGGAITLQVDARTHTFRDRRDVFWGVSDWAYVGIDNEFTITALTNAQIAIPSAKADHRFDAAFIPAEAVPIELRGAGQATRQLNNFMAPDVFDGAHRQLVELSAAPPRR